MQFTYQSYQDLLLILQQHGYVMTDYHNWSKEKRCVILRHDIDNDLECAYKLAELEQSCSVKSTYFVLVCSDFYNIFSKKNRKFLLEIQEMGHEIGLHFDEVCYPEIIGDPKAIIERILQEAALLKNIIEKPVTTVSMHRPSKKLLNMNLIIPGMINSYATLFFKDFKYLSDSRCNWREPVCDIVKSEKYDRLHILTHAFWYHTENKDIYTTVGNFIGSGNYVRYCTMKENITNPDDILKNFSISMSRI